MTLWLLTLYIWIHRCIEYTGLTSRLLLPQPWATDVCPASTPGNGNGAGALGWRRARRNLVLPLLPWCRGMQARSPQLSPLCHLHQHSHLLRVPLWERIYRRWHAALQPDVRVFTSKCVLIFPHSQPKNLFHLSHVVIRIAFVNLEKRTFHTPFSLIIPPTHRCYNECREGQCSGSPRFECECSLGWTSDPATLVLSGVECDVDCGCNFHSTCITAPGICDECQGET